MSRIKETDVGRFALETLTNLGFECWAEVPLASGRADIVACRGSLAWIVETKVAFSLALLDQAAARLREPCNGVLLVTGTKPRRQGAGYQWCESQGIGVLGWRCRSFLLWPALRRIDAAPLRARLMPEHQTYAAPGSQGRYWTPFKSLAQTLARDLEPGPLAEQMERLMPAMTYYARRAPAAQRRALADYLSRGLIEGWTLRREGRRLYVARRDA